MFVPAPQSAIRISPGSAHSSDQNQRGLFRPKASKTSAEMP